MMFEFDVLIDYDLLIDSFVINDAGFIARGYVCLNGDGQGHGWQFYRKHLIGYRSGEGDYD